MSVSDLYDPFDNLMSCYRQAEGPPLEHGTAILELIQGDWDVFSERLVESDAAGRLLEAILHSGWDDDSGDPLVHAYDPYVSRNARWSHSTLAEIWEEFAEAVKADPSLAPQFGDSTFHEFLVREDLRGRRATPLPEGSVLYRARLGFVPGADGPTPYSGQAMGAPPPDKAGPGRAAPKGEVVLYCADQEATAVAELRPARGEYVSVAEVHAATELEILDLATEPDWPNPFSDDAVNQNHRRGTALHPSPGATTPMSAPINPTPRAPPST